MMRLGKGEGRFEVGGSFGVGVGVGVGVEQLRNGGCLSVPSSYQTGRGSKHEPSFTGQATGWAGGLISNLTPVQLFTPPPNPPNPSITLVRTPVKSEAELGEQRAAGIEQPQLRLAAVSGAK